MTYLIQRVLRQHILRSRLLSVTLISLVLIALYATPASAQWTTSPNGTDIYKTTNPGNVGIGDTTPVSRLSIGPVSASLKAIPALMGNGIAISTSAGGNTLGIESTSGSGPFVGLWSNNSGLTTDGTRLGGFVFGGSSSASALRNATMVAGWATQLWADGSAYGTAIGFETTANGGTARTEKMRILGDGSVGIGTTSPTAKLHVVGDGKLTGNLTVDGNIAAKYQDVAEWVPASEQIPAGTVVVLDSTKSNHVISSTRGYDTRVAGVISVQPGIALGERGENKVLVATTGRVRIKVDGTRSPIHVGDLLVTSDKAGMAMKSQPLTLSGVQIHRPGTLIGKALEPLAKGRGEILVLLSLQ